MVWLPDWKVMRLRSRWIVTTRGYNSANLAERNDADLQRMRSEEDTLYRRLDKILQALANG
jgi:hypothetical protein